jgi:hypothetical protein
MSKASKSRQGHQLPIMLSSLGLEISSYLLYTIQQSLFACRARSTI